MENCTELEIRKMPDGGFMVGDIYHRDSGFVPRGPRFASTSIEDALKYIRDKLVPVAAK